MAYYVLKKDFSQWYSHLLNVLKEQAAKHELPLKLLDYIIAVNGV